MFVFIIAFLTFRSDTRDVLDLQQEGVVLVDALHEVENIRQMTEKSPDEIRRETGMNTPFCMYLVDEQGNLMLIETNTTTVGDAVITVDGQPCG